MSGDRPTKESLQRGMTVEVEQTGADNADGTEPITGEVRQVLTDEHSHPEGIEVELQSGVTGRVVRVAPDE